MDNENIGSLKDLEPKKELTVNGEGKMSFILRKPKNMVYFFSGIYYFVIFFCFTHYDYIQRLLYSINIDKFKCGNI